jgi:hypothetical protein
MLAIADATHFHLKMMVFSVVAGAKRKTRWWFFVLFVTR